MPSRESIDSPFFRDKRHLGYFRHGDLPMRTDHRDARLENGALGSSLLIRPLSGLGTTPISLVDSCNESLLA